MSGLVVDLFAGGGGASLGLAAALGRRVDVAINHDKVALAVHRANHPETLHLETDVWEVKPLDATQGRPVDVLWASPDCTHFSVAKGDVPRSQNIRSLAWIVVRWARDVAPAVIFLENVSEFRSWGPLGKDGKPLKRRAGETFAKWCRHLRRLGYAVDFRVLDASEYGAPTKRRRLFLVARRDGRPIAWPEPTHGPGRLPFHTAAECVDWSLTCPSIFERKKPLADKTLWRIAEGIRRFVLESPAPFIVKFRGDAHSSAIDAPVPTITAGPAVNPAGAAHALGLAMPHLIKVNHGKREARGSSLELPLTTVTATQRGHALVAPSLVKVDHGDDDKTGQRSHSLEEPLRTVTASGGAHALIAPTLVQTGYGEDTKRNGGLGQAARALDLQQPLGTVVAGGQKHALVSAFLAKHFGGVVGHQVERPIGAVTAKDHHSLAAATLVKLRGACNGADVEAPLPTLTARGLHVGEVRAFLTTYYGTDGPKGQSLKAPMRVVRAKHCLGLVTVAGVDYQIADIGMRMLEPHELLRAQFGAFAAQYDLSAARTKSAKVRLIGNSVCPEQALAVVSANRPQAAEAAA